MQDFTGVPAVLDLAALRGAVARSGLDPKRVNPFIAVDLIIDHSVQVDRFGSSGAYAANLEWEYRRNRERYALLNWVQQAFEANRGAVVCSNGHRHAGEDRYCCRVEYFNDGGILNMALRQLWSA